jgi:hypothetical protein
LRGVVFFGGVFFAVLVGNVALRRDRPGCCSSRSPVGSCLLNRGFFAVVDFVTVAVRR